MNLSEHPSNLDTINETTGAELDRLEVPAGKIGLNTPEQAVRLLTGLDSVYRRIQGLEPGSSSRKIAEAQFNGIVAKIRKEAAPFVRDLGGVHALQQVRSDIDPPEEHWWWYLDGWLAQKRRAALRRSLITAGAVVVVLIILATLYNRYLAPSPEVAARYGHEQNALDRVTAGDFAAALNEVDLGLAVAPNDPALLVLKGVVQENLKENDQAAQSFAAAQAAFADQENFLLTRGQDYLTANQLDKALADAQGAVRLAPQSAQAYLLLGQVFETQRKYQEALDAYNQAFTAADKGDQPELAALSRMHTAMVMQLMGAQAPTDQSPTPSPTP